MRWPIAKGHIVTQWFNPPKHFGVDWSCVEDSELYAAISGRVAVASQAGGFGLYVRITSGKRQVYTAHMNRVNVRTDQWVTEGDLIGWSGNTGNSTGPHLHFEVRDDFTAVDPWPLLEGAMTSKLTLHAQRTEPWMGAWMDRVKTPWGKVVNPGADDPFPNQKTLVRFWTDPTDKAYISRGRQGGIDWVRDQAPRWPSWAECIETWNEPGCNNLEDLTNLCQATLGALEEANRRGKRLCILNLPEASPHDDNTHNEAVVSWKWEKLIPALKLAGETGHYVGLHAYFRPDVEGPTGRYHALGRRKDDIGKLADLGLDVSKLRILINEYGIDGGIAGHTETERKGWRTLCSQVGVYPAQLVEGDRYAQTVPQFQMVAVFTVGAEDPWYDMELWEVHCERLGDMLLAAGEYQAPWLPSTDQLTLEAIASGNPLPIWIKRRWWNEEATRRLKAKDYAGALAILEDMAQPVTGLDYIVEESLTFAFG